MPIRLEQDKELTYENFENAHGNYQAFLYGEKYDIGGGTIEKEEIDILRQYPGLTRIRIMGLHQDTFEYFIENYGRQFKAISFFKNKMVSDLSPLSQLDGLEVLAYFVNQRAVSLWDMSRNKSLKMLGINDFSRLHDLSGIEKAPSLECLSFGNIIWAKSEVDCIPDLERSSLKKISFNADVDHKNVYKFLSIKGLERLDFRVKQYPTEFLAWICANYHGLEGYCLKPYIDHKDGSGRICGKRKRYFSNLNEEKAQKAIEKAEKNFEAMKEKFAGLSFDEILSVIDNTK